MPDLDLSQNLLSASADYAAGDWLHAEGSGSIAFRGVGELKRGIDLEIGASALVEVEAAFSKFIAGSGAGHAQASARLTGQLQAPNDLFDEIGVALRLQAVAEAGVGVTLAIGLAVGDFIALAEQDPRIRGVAAKLLRIFLEDLEIKGGVKAHAAVSAMAYVNVVLTGKLDLSDPKFELAGEYGVGESSPFLVETLHGSRWVMQPSSSISSTSSPQFSALAGGLRGALEDDGSRSPSSGAVRCR